MDTEKIRQVFFKDLVSGLYSALANICKVIYLHFFKCFIYKWMVKNCMGIFVVVVVET